MILWNDQAGPRARQPYKYTPLDFVNRDEWFMTMFWAYYTQCLRNIHLGICFIRPKVPPRDRIPTINWPKTTIRIELWSGTILLAYNTLFLLAWNFHFATPLEQILWRVASIIAVAFVVVGGVYVWYLRAILRKRSRDDERSTPQAQEEGEKEEKAKAMVTSLPRHSSSRAHPIKSIANKLRNNSPDHDPLLTIPLRVWVPVTIVCFLYCVSRAYILIEDAIGLRQLPVSAFETVEWAEFVPHI